MVSSGERAWIFDIQGHAVHDGPGCRTLVFMSGCPLRCRWCANPEGWLPRPRLMVSESRCQPHCRRCLEACRHQAIQLGSATRPRLVFNREKCERCQSFECVEACYHQALRICGAFMTVNELMRVLQRDRDYWGPEGGVTFTGGDPLMQKEFLMSVLPACRQAWMHTAVETCGHVATGDLLEVLRDLDWLLMDIKHMDPEQHRLGTGTDNRLILKNVKTVALSDWPGRLVLRLPLIPGFNDERSNLQATADFLLSLGLDEIEVLPFHRLGHSKYEQLGLPDPYADQEAPSPERVLQCRSVLERRGVRCHTNGDQPY